MLLNIITALPAEAAPLLRHFQLKRCAGGAMPVYENVEQELRLVVCGVGSERAARAVHALHAAGAGQPPQQGWLNIGIAGHGSAALGQCLSVSRIHDRDSNKTAYTHIWPDQAEMPATHLVTVSAPELHYGEDAAYDMEGFGFFKAAVQCSMVELVALLKIVSDNPDNRVDSIDRSAVEGLIEDSVAAIDSYQRRLQQRVQQYQEVYALPAQYLDLSDRVRLTVTQQSQLMQLCRRLLALGRGDQLNTISSRHWGDSRSLLNELKQLARSGGG